MTTDYIDKLLLIAHELETIIKNKNMFAGEIDYNPEFEAKINQLLGYILALEYINSNH